MRRIGIEWFFLQTRRISSQHANMEHSIWQEYPVCPVMPIIDFVVKKISEHCGDISFYGIHVRETWGLFLEAHEDHSRPQVRCSLNQFIILDQFELYLCHFRDGIHGIHVWTVSTILNQFDPFLIQIQQGFQTNLLPCIFFNAHSPEWLVTNVSHLGNRGGIENRDLDQIGT